MIREAEASKAHIYEISGNTPKLNIGIQPQWQTVGDGEREIEQLSHRLTHSMLVDEQFMMVVAHIDDLTKAKIQKDQYVKFSKLLAKDQIDGEDEQRMWIPVSERDITVINSFNRWEQAFCVFSHIYL